MLISYRNHRRLTESHCALKYVTFWSNLWSLLEILPSDQVLSFQSRLVKLNAKILRPNCLLFLRFSIFKAIIP